MCATDACSLTRAAPPTTAPTAPLTADATESTVNGYLLTVTCSCGALFGRWITPEDAELDLLPRGVAELSFKNHQHSSG